MKTKSPYIAKIKNLIEKNPQLRREGLELLYNGETLEDIYNYLHKKAVTALNDKILTEMGI